MYVLKDLKVWNKAMEITEKVYRLSANFPREERYGLTSQIRRCAVSVPSNIAEGAGRNTNGEFKNFLSIANGSAYELFTQLILSYKLKLVPKEDVEYILKEIIEVQKMNYALIKLLNK
ncbi:four helix bundle protein [Mesonia sp. K4-1]|nr:four helix bundle protein [Mesonia sp. K4-1]TXK75653.1 four helix bundle protein [Mesonia sp. K4-1]